MVLSRFSLTQGLRGDAHLRHGAAPGRDPLGVLAGPMPAGEPRIGIPYRGPLPSLRFVAGAIVLLLGIAGVMGQSTGDTWLAQGRASWIPLDPLNAYVLMLLGGLLMLSWIPAARTACWILPITTGIAALLQYALIQPLVSPHEPAMEGSVVLILCPSSAAMLILVASSILVAAPAPLLALAIDGIILGFAGTTLAGYVFNHAPLFLSPFLGGISFPEAIAFSVIGVFFLAADREIASMSAAARGQPPSRRTAIGLTAFALTAGLRIAIMPAEAGANAPSVSALALGAAGLAVGFAAASIVLPRLSRRGVLKVSGAQAAPKLQRDLSRATELLNTAHDDYAQLAHALGEDMRLFAIRLRHSALQLSELLSVERTGEARETAEEILSEARALSQLLASLGQPDTLRPRSLDIETLDFRDVLEASIAQGGFRNGPRQPAILREQAHGRIRGDQFLLTCAVERLLARAMARSADATPIISVRLIAEDEMQEIRISCGGIPPAGEAQTPVPIRPSTQFVDRVARWHGGYLSVTIEGRVQTWILHLPGSARMAG